MSADHINRRRDLIIAGIVILTLALTGLSIIAGETAPVPYLIGGGIVLILITLGYTHTRKGQQERTEALMDHLKANSLTQQDLTHLAGMLDGPVTGQTRTALTLLEEPYSQGETEQSLMAFIAGDSRDASAAIVHAVIDLLDADDSTVARAALQVIHSTSIDDRDLLGDAAETMIADLQDSQDPDMDAIRQRTIFLARNRQAIDTAILEANHNLIQDLLTVDDPATATMAGLLIGELIRWDRQVPESDIDRIMDTLQDLLDRYSTATEDQQDQLLSFITADLSVLRRAARTDPAHLEGRLEGLTTVFDLEHSQIQRAVDIVRALAEDHPRSLEPVFGDLLTLLDGTDDPDLARTILEALAHMRPRVTDGEDEFARIIASQLTGSGRRPATYLLFRLADENPATVADALPDPTPLLTDDDLGTRRYGFGLLARLAASQPHIIEAHLQTITTALEDDPEAGKTALTALYRYTAGTGTDITGIGEKLVPYLDADDRHSRMAAKMLADAITEDPDRYSSLRPVLEDMLDRDDPEIVVQACRGLEAIGTEESRGRLQDRLGDDDHQVRVAAAKAFTAIGDRTGDDGGDKNPLEGASERLERDKKAIARMAAAEEGISSITIDSDGDIHGDILIYGDKEVTEVDADLDESTEIRDSVQKDVEMDRD